MVKQNKKAAGLSSKMLEEVERRREFEDKEEMVNWRSINQEEVNGLERTVRENEGGGLGDVQS